MKQKVWVARMIFLDVLETLEQYFDVVVNRDDRLLTRDELIARAADKNGALTSGDRIDAAVLAAALRLKGAANMALGYNHFDMDAFNRAGVLGINTRDVLGAMRAC
ncbi:hypothetical protein KQH60_03580 [Mycetohabitans sp. B8]|nr:hypothetical protein [Mycetohabitans sp. B8]